MITGRLVDRKTGVVEPVQIKWDNPSGADIARVLGGDGTQEALISRLPPGCREDKWEVHRLPDGDKCLVIGVPQTEDIPKRRKSCSIGSAYAKKLCGIGAIEAQIVHLSGPSVTRKEMDCYLADCDIAEALGSTDETTTWLVRMAGHEIHCLPGNNKYLVIGSPSYPSDELLRDGTQRYRSCGLDEAKAIQLCAKVNARSDTSKLCDAPIQDVHTFVQTINQLVLADPSAEFYFRGHPDEKYKLIPSVYRPQGKKGNTLVPYEDKMFRDIILRCPDEFAHLGTTLERLVKMQHYLLPTRLLDITRNPLVALYFAANKLKKKDGEVLMFKLNKSDIKYYDSDTVSVIANLAKMKSGFDVSDILTNPRKAFHKEEAIIKLLHQIKEEKPYFRKAIVPNHIGSVVCVKPKLGNSRILKQDGAFFLFGIDGKKQDCAKFPDRHYRYHTPNRLIIDSSAKQTIIEQLESLGVNKATLFPEIEAVAEFTRDSYMKGN